MRWILKHARYINAITIVGVVILFGGICEPPVFAKGSKEIIEESISSLIATKDNVALEAEKKAEEEQRVAKETLKKIVAIGITEATSFQKKVGVMAIETLVTDDYSFDAEAIKETLNQLLAYYISYYEEIGKRIESTTKKEAVRTIAKDIDVWRNELYNPGIQIILSIDLVLKGKSIVAIGNSRFEKILVDLRRLKKNKLINMDELEPLLRQATANQKIANSLDREAMGLLLQTLNRLKADDRNAIGTANYKKIKHQVGYLFERIRDMYKQFLEINKQVKTMLEG